jgi:ankyrin repeat protein
VNKQKTTDGSTPLFMAAQNGHLKIVQTLLTKEDIDVNKPKKDGCTPLFIAAQNGHLKIVQTLLTIRDDIDVNKPHVDGRTPLIMACYDGHMEIVRLLVQQSNIRLNQSGRGNSALGWATQKNHTEIIQLLTEAGAQ